MTLATSSMGNISGTVTLDCGSPLAFNGFAATLTGDVTLLLNTTNCTAGVVIQTRLTQDSGGQHKVTWPTGFAQACAPTLDAGITTTQTFGWDGSNAYLIGDCKDSSPGMIIRGPERAAPSSLPPAGGNEFWWMDLGNHLPQGYSSTSTLSLPFSFVQTANSGTANQFVDYLSPSGTLHTRAIVASDLPGGVGQSFYPLVGTQPVCAPTIFSLTNPVTVASTASATTLLGGKFSGTNSIPAYCFAPGSTLRIVGGGTLGTLNPVGTFSITVKLGSTVVATLTPTLGNADTDQWSLDYTIAAESLTTVAGSGCLYITGSTNTNVCPSATTGSLALNSSFSWDVQVTWGTSSSSNTITSNVLFARLN